MANVQLKDLNSNELWYPKTTIAQVENLDTTLNTLATKDALTSGLAGLKSEILGDDLTETFNTLKAVQEWANTHGTQYGALVADVATKAVKSEVDNSIAVINADLAKKAVKDDVDSSLEEINNVMATKATKSEVTSAISALDTKFETIDNVTSKIAELNTIITGLQTRIQALEDKNVSNVEGVVE